MDKKKDLLNFEFLGQSMKPSKIMLYTLVFIAVLALLMPMLGYMGITSKYAELSKSTQGTLFKNALLSTANEEAKHLWTEQGVYDFIQSLARYNFTHADIGNPTEEDVDLPDGRTLKAEVITAKLGAVMTLDDFFSLIRDVEKQGKLVYIFPTSANNLDDYKEIQVKFYLAPDVPKPENYPVTAQYTVYGLDSMFVNKGDITKGNAIIVPVFYNYKLWYGVFVKDEKTAIRLLVR